MRRRPGSTYYGSRSPNEGTLLSPPEPRTIRTRAAVLASDVRARIASSIRLRAASSLPSPDKSDTTCWSRAVETSLIVSSPGESHLGRKCLEMKRFASNQGVRRHLAT